MSLPTPTTREAQLQFFIKSYDLVLAYKCKVWKFRRSLISRDHSFNEEDP